MIEIIIIIICIVNASQHHVCGWLSCLGQYLPHSTAQAHPQIRSNEKWPPHLWPAALRPLFTLVCPAVPSPQSTLSCMYTYLLKMPPGNQVSFVCHMYGLVTTNSFHRLNKSDHDLTSHGGSLIGTLLCLCLGWSTN